MKTIYEDDHILVIDKPAGVEMGEFTTRSLGEGWPAHRLDKDTSGLLVVAKNAAVLEKLQDQFKKRQVTKAYLALVYGEMAKEGELVTEIVRDPSRKVPFKAVAVASGLERGDPRVAKTAWQVVKKLTINHYPLTLVRVHITTGRTHQIRVHMKYLGYPIMGDQVYFTKPSRELSRKLGLKRQFLHAARLDFTHPVSGKKLYFKTDLPADLTMDRIGLM
ncbi:MAG: RluA family pseudouridine synthase [Patescibacteria group bacterium]